MKTVATKSFFNSIKELDSLKNKWRSLKSWFRYHFNKDFFRIIKVCLKGYPWQESFLYELERAKIQEMMNYHDKVRRFVGVEDVIRDMRLCISLIDIFGNEDKLYHYDGKLNFVRVEGTDNFEIKGDDLKYFCVVKVNTNNVDRFCNSEVEKKWFIKHPHELYVRKAKHLYHKIRCERDDMWWD